MIAERKQHGSRMQAMLRGVLLHRVCPRDPAKKLPPERYWASSTTCWARRLSLGAVLLSSQAQLCC
jgi:hypothetical protein